MTFICALVRRSEAVKGVSHPAGSFRTVSWDLPDCGTDTHHHVAAVSLLFLIHQTHHHTHQMHSTSKQLIALDFISDAIAFQSPVISRHWLGVLPVQPSQCAVVTNAVVVSITVLVYFDAVRPFIFTTAVSMLCHVFSYTLMKQSQTTIIMTQTACQCPTGRSSSSTLFYPIPFIFID